MDKVRFQSALKLLDEERAALRAGQLEQVAGLADRKTALMQDLTALRLSAQDAKRLRLAASENAKLLQAALSGLRSAQERLAELRAVRAGLNIYNAHGDKETVSRKSGGLEHKV